MIKINSYSNYQMKMLLLVYRVFISTLFFFITIHVFSQNKISFRQLSVKEGLSQNSTVSIAQDSLGYLWMATQDGLNRYDGNDFNYYPFTFTDITKASYSKLGKVYVDRNGKIWIIPSDGNLYRYVKEKDTFDKIATIGDASCIFQDKHLNIWIGTFSNGLFKLDMASNTLHEIINYSEIRGSIFNIVQFDKETIALVSKGKIIKHDIFEHTNNVLKPTSANGKRIDTNFSSISIDRDGKTWYGTFGNGLFYSHKNEEVFSRVSASKNSKPIPSDLNIQQLFIDSSNRLWIATYGNGLYMLNLNNFEIHHYDIDKHDPKALHYKDVLSIYEDYSKTLWFGTDGAGLSFYDSYLDKFNSFTNLQTPENINIDVVRAITVDKNQNVWIGTSGKGLTQFNPKNKSWRTFTTSNSKLPSNRIVSLNVDNDNVLWIGTQGSGLYLFSDEFGFKHQKTNSRTVWSIYKDKKNNFWLGTRENGIINYSKSNGIKQQFKHNPKNKNTIPSDNIRVITEDLKGNLWIGTENSGIAKLEQDSGDFRRYKSKEKKNTLSSNKIKSLFYAPNNILWIGTNGGGLNAFDVKTSKFYNYTTETGLSNNVIYAVLPDEQNSLWLSSNKGITKFSIQDNLKEKPHIVNYKNYAGLATEFNTGAYHVDSSGTLYFGGLDGFYWFKPKNIKTNNRLPKTTITKLEVLDKPYRLNENLKLDYKQNTVAFEFSGLQFSMPERTQYQYRLIDYETEWVNSGNKNYVRYARLPAGEYTFQVKSTNYDGIWNDRPETFSFSIANPWYLTTAAKIVYVLLILLSIFLIYKYLKWKWAVELDLKVKKEETERLKKINKFKSKLYTDISHEFRTPLTLISGPIDAKLSQGKLTDADFANFSMIKRNTNRLLTLVDQLLALAKLDKGKLKLKIQKGELDLFLKSIASAFNYKAEANGIAYTYKISSIKNAWYDEDVVEKIVTNLLTNALKYCSSYGSCSFKAYSEKPFVIFEVSNTVEDPSEIQIDKLFTRFYQKENNSEGAGIGLSLVKELVKLHKGDIGVFSIGNGITFTCKILIEKSVFDSKHILKPSTFSSKTDEKIKEIIDIDSELTSNDNELPLLLIIEDNKEVRAFIKSALKLKYNVFEAGNSKEGIEQALNLVPDIIISDIRMPGMDGIEMCNILKSDERTSHIPIIILTAGSGEEEELKGLESGADDFITKPFKLRILEKRLENLINTRKALRTRYSQELILKPKDISITPTDEVFLKKVQSILDKELSNPKFNASKLSRLVGMSRMQLHRKLLAYTNLSTSAFIRSQRLKLALQMLNSSEVNINEIAYSVGFNTPSYFIKCFKEAYKKTPMEFVNEKTK